MSATLSVTSGRVILPFASVRYVASVVAGIGGFAIDGPFQMTAAFTLVCVLAFAAIVVISWDTVLAVWQATPE